MKLSISNIAWDLSEENKVMDIMRSYNLNGIEIAPTKLWEIPIDLSDQTITDYLKKTESFGLRIVAMQSLLFNRNDLCIFADQDSREKTYEYLCGMIQLAARIGAKNLVFGSPKNRKTEGLNLNSCFQIATDFFYRLGQFAEQNNVVFCIEPNPSHYGCDFVTNTKEGIELVKEVNHKGFRLHLDTAAMTLNEESYAHSIEASIPYLSHFHISEPFLELIGSANTNHASVSDALKGSGYDKWISIEMKNNLLADNVIAVERALDFVTRSYMK